MRPQHSSGDILADRRYLYAEGCLADGDFSGAADLAEQALSLAPGYAAAWLLLGRAREGLFGLDGDPAHRDGARAAYAAARAADPADALGAGMHLARLGCGADPAALSPAYLRTLFDGYAPRFEAHLVDGLHYVGPALLRTALPAEPAHFAAALDLGCGTGLMGAAIRDRVGHLGGVDLSPEMLARARAKAVYDRLVTAELGAFLAGEPAASADLCLAADVFIYVADLAPVLREIARVLRPEGLAAFTVQSPDADAPGAVVGAASGAILGADGRYAHPDAHLAAAAAGAGLAILTCAAADVRRERGRPVPGRVAVLRRGHGAPHAEIVAPHAGIQT
ncbi:methyltransferase domain-containing protein [Methylobacterium sp. NEAU 140]|uniref:class I SAM-dependent DNA methyltransferase n=1 Tax=Methylobacterium sp. NEAU 140 TaxID=3064945 RepID=UPI0027345B9E|nr:methyltransferase domain-containing protein [Methylobacterium sp. NEAU 140]MDP4021618.1 methyltransferase domain-containing protein [Methylobacterium sp. NEAU 140]